MACVTGSYTVEAIPFSGSGLSGAIGIGKTVTFYVIDQEVPCETDVDCNDNYACTEDECQDHQCYHTTGNCNDNNVCTDDECVNGICENVLISGCCHTNADCDDSDVCTIDECNNNVCEHTPNSSSEPSYLHVENYANSWKKLKLGYSSTSLYQFKENVIAGGNTMMCVTLRGSASINWNRILIRPQGSISLPVSLGGYGLGTSLPRYAYP